MTDCGRRTMLDARSERPVLQYHGLRGRDPVQPAGRHRARRCAEGNADGREAIVAVEPRVDPVRFEPELREARIEIDEHAGVGRTEQGVVDEKP
jgi:hypothetical protein